MNLKTIVFVLNLLPMTIFGMQQSSLPEAPLSAREAARKESFKMQQLQKLQEAMPVLKNKLKMAALRKDSKKDMKKPEVQTYPFVGPQVFDIISSNCAVVKNRFALADQDEGAADIYQAQSPFKQIMNLPAQGVPFGINAIAANKQDQIAMDSGNNIIVWDMEEQEQVATLKGHIDIVSSLDFDPKNPNILASGSYDTTIKLWDLRNRDNRCIVTLTDTAKIYSVAFSPIVEQLVSVNASNDRALGLWFLINRVKIATASGSWTAKYNHAGQNVIAGLPGEIVLYNAALEQIKSVQLPGEWAKNGAIPGAFDFSESDAQVVVSGPLEDIFIFNGDLSGNPIDIQSGMLGVDSHWMGNNILSSAYGCSYDGGSYVRIWDVAQIRRVIQENLARQQTIKLAELRKEEATGCNLQ